MAKGWDQIGNPLREGWREINRFLGQFLTPAVRAILLVNIGVFILFVLLAPFSQSVVVFFRALALTPSDALGLPFPFLWQFVTYMFLHGGLWHLLINMVILWFFAPRLEYRWGTREFLQFYFTVGVGAALLHTVVAFATGHAAGAPMLGASGVMYGIILVCAIYHPNDLVYLYLLVPVRLKYFAIILGVLTFFASIETVAGGDSGGIAHVTHLGGLLVAWLYLKGGPWLRRRRRRRPPVYKVDPKRHPDFR